MAVRKSRNNYRQTNSIHKLFCSLPQRMIQTLARNVCGRGPKHGLTYVDEKGKIEAITLTLRPRLIHSQKRDALWRDIRALDGAFRKIAFLYFQNPGLAPLFPFSPAERRWLRILREPAYIPGRLVTRWDSNTTFDEGDWKSGWSFFEVNGVGVGGLWYGPACAEVVLETVIPELRKLDPHFRPALGHDMRRLLLGSLVAQRRKLGRTRGVLALAMEKASGSNYEEFLRLARLYTRLGQRSIVVEPTDFILKKDEVYAKGKPVDMIYRDTTLSELCAFEEKGHSMTALREAFRRGRVISSLEGEFDHKSAFELFTNPEYARAFTPKERTLFRRHILWTRLLAERRTTDPSEKKIDLIPFVFRHKDRLVLKPNRLYGGKGVVFGRDLKHGAWEKKIEAVLKEPGDWVIQKIGELRRRRFFRRGVDGVHEKDLYVVSGLFATEKGLGIVGRMSERTVVNVARRGGLTPILLVE